MIHRPTTRPLRTLAAGFAFLLGGAFVGVEPLPAAAAEPAAPESSRRVRAAARPEVCLPGTGERGELAALLAETPETCCSAQTPPTVCGDSDCFDLICFEIDPFCCTEWDAICAGYANSICGVCGGSLCPGTLSCCTGNPNRDPKCSDPECCGLVCNLDPTCCAINWDKTCSDLAQDLCTTCGGGAGECCTAHATPSCNDEPCALAVCQQDPYCCEFEWDATCVAAAAELCDTSAICPRALTVAKSGAGTGSITGIGINCPGDCTESYGYGTMVTLTAAATGGSEFSGWSGDCTGFDPECQVTMTANRSVTGTFTPGPQTLNVSLAGSGTGTVTDGDAGDLDCPGTCSDTYPYDTVVTLTATPTGGASFVGWGGEASACGTTATCQITLSEQRDVTATFQPPQTLNVTVSGGGSVADGPEGDIACPGTCSDTYPFNTVVTLTRTTPAGWLFAGWTGEASGCGTNATCPITMSEQRDVGASFVPVLTVSKAGGGLGSVADGPEGDISCGATCSDSYPLDTVVTLAATPTAPSGFGGWSGDCTGTAECQVTMSAPRAVTATFDPGLAVTVTGSGTGSVADTTPGGTIACPGDCDEVYSTGAAVTLEATPAVGSLFGGWSGDCAAAGSDPTCNLTLSANRSATATFSTPNGLTVVVVGAGSVADSTPGGTIACPGDCDESYAPGASVTLVATPDSGELFAGWSGDCTGTGDCVLTMSAARSVTATFSLFADDFETTGDTCRWSDRVGSADSCTP
jgi:hypothetical protein